jgi:5'-methylthioinosine phosphorylase
MLDAQSARREAREIYSSVAIDTALGRMAEEITADLAGKDPVVVAVMQGGVFTAVRLGQRLQFPHEFDYVHVTRYGHELEGGQLRWIVPPTAALRDRVVLLVDDVLDHGITLAALRDELLALPVAELKIAVLARKSVAAALSRPAVDYVGVEAGSGYLFGCGMDYRGHWRNLPAVYEIDSPDSAPTAGEGAPAESVLAAHGTHAPAGGGSGIAVIVGSGFSHLGVDAAGGEPVSTPFGMTSSPLWRVSWGGRSMLCVARHGPDHSILPHAVNYRANLWALHAADVRWCIAINVVGSIVGNFPLGTLAIPTQLIDYTWGRAATFAADGGPVRHVELTTPFDEGLQARLIAAAGRCDLAVSRGVYGVTQGPRLETAAEIDRLERDGCTMVGMTAMPEAALARELGIRYALCAFAVNHAAGRAPSGVTIHGELEHYVDASMASARKLLDALIPDLPTVL